MTTSELPPAVPLTKIQNVALRISTGAFVSLAFRVSCLAILLLALPAAIGQGRLKGRGNARRFISPTYGFSMAVPSGWSVSTALDTPVYFYSPARERFVQDRIPKNGAVITVKAHDTSSGLSRSAGTPAEWAVADARGISSDVPSVRPLEMPRESEVFRAVTSSWDETAFSPDQQVQHSVAIF
jgi:hypothetical protein